MRVRSALGPAVLVLFVLSVALWAAMAFGTLAHLRRLAGGLAPFDLRPFGYWPDDVRALVTALGEGGRAFYADVQLRLDSVYPALYALSRALLIWWLTMPGRIAGRDAALPLRLALMAMPVLAAALDYWENASIAAILAAGDAADRVTIGSASIATETKSLTVTLTEFVCLALAGSAAWQWWNRRQAEARKAAPT